MYQVWSSILRTVLECLNKIYTLIYLLFICALPRLDLLRRKENASSSSSHEVFFFVCCDIPQNNQLLRKTQTLYLRLERVRLVGVCRSTHRQQVEEALLRLLCEKTSYEWWLYNVSATEAIVLGDCCCNYWYDDCNLVVGLGATTTTAPRTTPKRKIRPISSYQSLEDHLPLLLTMG